MAMKNPRDKSHDDSNMEFTLEECIELELHGISTVINCTGGGNPEFRRIRKFLASLLNAFRHGAITPERAEKMLEQAMEDRRIWGMNNPIPPD
jgi:hypothetical protein